MKDLRRIEVVGPGFWVLRENRERTKFMAHKCFRFEPGRYTTVLVVCFGDEWKFASERGSIQPRVPFSGAGRIRAEGRVSASLERAEYKEVLEMLNCHNA
jgi:hypothetical protein